MVRLTAGHAEVEVWRHRQVVRRMTARSIAELVGEMERVLEGHAS